MLCTRANRRLRRIAYHRPDKFGESGFVSNRADRSVSGGDEKQQKNGFTECGEKISVSNRSMIFLIMVPGAALSGWSGKINRMRGCFIFFAFFLPGTFPLHCWVLSSLIVRIMRFHFFFRFALGTVDSRCEGQWFVNWIGLVVDLS